MKRIVMAALLSTLAVGSFANIDRPKKHKRYEQCTQKHCPPDCKDKGCCNKSNCAKAA